MKQRRKLSIALIGMLAFMVFGASTLFGTAEDADPKADPKAAEQPAATEQTQAADAPAGAGGPEALYPITATKKVLDNDKYELYIDEKTANVRIVDKRTGTEWLGAPQLSRRALPNEKKYVDSPVHIRFTEGADITQTYTLKDKETKLAIEATEDKVRVEFNLELIKISFAVEYRLTDNGFEATIPDDSIKETGLARLTSLEVLPFLNAAKETDNGALFLPDGSGALLRFRETHPAYLRGYSEPIYGTDPAFVVQNHDFVDSQWRRVIPRKESIALPVFGIYRNGIGVASIVTEGEYDARINGTPAGIRNIKLYRTSVEFLYRKDDVIFIGTSGLIPYYQGQRVTGDRTVRYVLLEGDDADYVGMAKSYREYLLKEKNVKPVTQDRPRLNIKLFGGIERDEIIGSTFIEMTTFEQAKTIIDTYKKAGMTAIELTFSGWTNNGIYGDQPDHFPVEKKLGGMKGLEELLRYAEENGIGLYLAANYVRPFSRSDGMSKRNDTVRGMDREVLGSFNYYPSDRWNIREEEFYLLKPNKAFDKHIQDETDDFAELKPAGVHFDYMGNLIYSDQSKGDLTDRSVTAGVWQKALALFRGKVGKTSVDYGFAYTLGRVDRIDNAPVDSSHFVYTDETVPFYQIVLHGLVPYYASPVNLMDDPANQILRMVEYGALPSFELTYAATSDLQRTMEDRLFSSNYRDWLKETMAEHKRLEQLYAGIDGAPITDHEKLREGLYKTSYENGVQVLVNYGETDATVDGTAVKAKGFTMKGGASK